MVCHTCGFTTKIPTSCPECKHPDIIHKGFGTKLLEAELKRLYKKAKIVRFDTDNDKDSSLDQLYDDVKDGKYDIIIGTSEKMCDTVFRGLIGSGDQRLYDYYCRSKSMYIRFTRGEVGELAELEQKIREEFKDDLAKVEKKHISKGKKSKKRH